MPMHSLTIWFTGGGKCSDLFSEAPRVEILRSHREILHSTLSIPWKK